MGGLMRRLGFCAALPLVLPCLAQAAAEPAAACTRTLQVPVAPIGQAVTASKGKQVGGIYPDMLRAGLAGKPGCTVNFPLVPRARQEMLFETGQADLLLPARRSPRRDEHGVFVPMIQTRAVLVSLLPTPRPALQNLDELRSRRELRVVVVRGYDYGPAYQALLNELAEQGRLQQVADPLALARTLDSAMAEVAILTPTILTGALRGEPRLAPLAARLRHEPVEELGWGESGVYVSNKPALSKADRQLLIEQLEQLARSGAAWRAFQRHHPESSLSETVQPR